MVRVAAEVDLTEIARVVPEAAETQGFWVVDIFLEADESRRMGKRQMKAGERCCN